MEALLNQMSLSCEICESCLITLNLYGVTVAWPKLTLDLAALSLFKVLTFSGRPLFRLAGTSAGG